MNFLKKHGWLLVGIVAILLTVRMDDRHGFIFLLLGGISLGSRDSAFIGKSLLALASLSWTMKFLERESVEAWLSSVNLTPRSVLVILVAPFLLWKLWRAATANIHELQGRGVPFEREAE